MGVESPTAVGTATVGGFTGAGLLAGGCRNMWELNPQQQLVDSQVWTVSWWLWQQQAELQQLVDSQVLDF